MKKRKFKSRHAGFEFHAKKRQAAKSRVKSKGHISDSDSDDGHRKRQRTERNRAASPTPEELDHNTTTKAKTNDDGQATQNRPGLAKIKKRRAVQAKKCRDLEEKSKQMPFRKEFWDGPCFPTEDAPQELKLLRKEIGVTVKGISCPAPVMRIDDKHLPQSFETYFRSVGYTKPAPVQSQCWPACLMGRDCVVLAQAGSGKTLGYVLPLIPHIQDQPKVFLHHGPIALILVPTRELARQVAATCAPLKRLFQIRCAYTHGGEDKQDQIGKLKAGVEILVSTPGRLLDLLQVKATHLGRVTVCVLDEADKMLEMGFEDQLNTLRRQLRETRQTLLFSATFPARVEETASAWMDPLNTVEIRLSAHKLEVSATITQIVHVCSEHKKLRKLLRFLEKLRAKEEADGKRNKGRILIFTNKIQKTTLIAGLISKHGHKCTALHGKLKQEDRKKVLFEFQNGKIPILVATDVAARGIHISKLFCVVNYDFPSSLVQYVHRVGRTGRQGELGHAFSFFTRNLAPMAKGLMRLLERTSQWIDPNLLELVKENEVEGAQDDRDDDEIMVVGGESDDDGAISGDVRCLKKVPVVKKKVARPHADDEARGLEVIPFSDSDDDNGADDNGADDNDDDNGGDFGADGDVDGDGDDADGDGDGDDDDDDADDVDD